MIVYRNGVPIPVCDGCHQPFDEDAKVLERNDADMGGLTVHFHSSSCRDRYDRRKAQRPTEPRVQT